MGVLGRPPLRAGVGAGVRAPGRVREPRAGLARAPRKAAHRPALLDPRPVDRAGVRRGAPGLPGKKKGRSPWRRPPSEIVRRESPLTAPLQALCQRRWTF